MVKAKTSYDKAVTAVSTVRAAPYNNKSQEMTGTEVKIL